MRYVLNENIDVCGWELLPYALRFRRKNKAPIIQFVNQEVFDCLMLCDGETDFDLPLFSDRERAITKELCENHVIVDIKEEKRSQKVIYTYYPNRYMSRVLWSVTGRCNAKCKHCYMSAPDAKFGELDHETIIKMAEDICATGVGAVSLTGGECLVRKDFFDIVDVFIRNKVCIEQIYTNGFLVNQKLLDKFKKRDIYPEFNMSFDGVGYHDWLRGIKGAEQMTLNALKLCHDNGFPTGIEMCLFKSNLHTLRKTINVLSSLGVRSCKTNPVGMTEYWAKYADEEDITYEELYNAYLEYIPQYYEDGKPLSIMLGGFFKASPKNDTYFIPLYQACSKLEDTCVCNHARGTMYIGPDGRSSTCMALCSMEIVERFPLVQEVGMKECLTNSTYMQFINTRAVEIVNHNKRCQNCEYRFNCMGGCRGSALYTNPTDLLAIDEAACLIFKGGYVPKIHEAVKKGSKTAKWNLERK